MILSVYFFIIPVVGIENDGNDDIIENCEEK